MKVLAVVAFALVISTNSNAQIKYEDFVQNIHSTNHNSIYVKSAVEVEGIPYLHEEWRTGIVTVRGLETEPFKIKYNIAENNFEINNGQQTIVVEGSTIEKVKLENPETVLKNGYKTNGKDNLTKDTFFEVLYEGKDIALLKKENVKLIKNVATYGTATRKDSYNRYTNYYLSKSGEFDDIKLRQRDILNIFPDHKDEVKKYIKDNKLSLRRDEDLMKIMKYGDSLNK